MRALVRFIDRTLAGFGIVILTIMVVCVIWQVISRYILGNPSTVTDELARLLFMSLGLIGGTYTAGQKRHLAIDLLPLFLHGTMRRNLGILVEIFILAFALIILLYGGGQLALDTLRSHQTSPILGWKIGYVYLSIPLSGALITFYSLLTIVEQLCGVSFRDARTHSAPGDA